MIATNNELDHLFSEAFGEGWITRGMQARTREELARVENLAYDLCCGALYRLADMGRLMGRGFELEDDAKAMGLQIAETAESASVFLAIATRAQELQDPDLRKALLPDAGELSP